MYTQMENFRKAPMKPKKAEPKSVDRKHKYVGRQDWHRTFFEGGKYQGKQPGDNKYPPAGYHQGPYYVPNLDRNIPLLEWKVDNCAAKLAELIAKRDAKLEDRRKVEKKVSNDVKRMQRIVRCRERAKNSDKYNPTFDPEHTDLSFWVKSAHHRTFTTPEEEKGTYRKLITHKKLEPTLVNSHARRGFVYWPGKDFVNPLSHPLDKKKFAACEDYVKPSLVQYSLKPDPKTAFMKKEAFMK